MMKLRKKLQRTYSKSKSDYDKSNLYSLIDCIQSEIKRYKSSLWKNFVEKLQGGNRYILCSIPFWKRINNLRNKKSRHSIGTIEYDGKEITSDLDKANVFADRLEKVFSNENNPRFDDRAKQKIDDYFDSKLFEKEYKGDEKNIKLVTEKELKNAIKNLNKKVSLDAANISNKILRRMSAKAQTIILKLFNLCLEKKVIPKSWKQSRVTMIQKKSNDTRNPANYRPISVTLCLARLFERIMLKRLQGHLRKNDIIVTEQSGFRKNRQTKDNITFLTQKVIEQFSVGKKIISVFFDIASAFDKVWHRGLLIKLIAIKTPYYLLCIISAFLEDRKFTVKINSSTRDMKSASSGVPQGGVLSPTLFSIFINDLPLTNIKNESFSMLFADDLVCSFVYKDKHIAQSKVEEHLKKLEMWSNKWRLTFAPKKSNVLVFSKKRKIDQMYNEIIPQSKEVKFLGITFDSKLNFKAHTQNIESSCKNRLNVIKVLSGKFWNLNKKVLLSIYKLIMRSLMEYSSIINNVANEKTIERLQVLQNHALRTILHKRREDGKSIIHEMANVPLIKNRFQELNERYFEKAELCENRLIKRLVEEYEGLKQSHSFKKSTILCNIEPWK